MASADMLNTVRYAGYGRLTLTVHCSQSPDYGDHHCRSGPRSRSVIRFGGVRHRQRRAARERDGKVDLPHRGQTGDNEQECKEGRIRNARWEPGNECGRPGGDNGQDVDFRRRRQRSPCQRPRARCRPRLCSTRRAQGPGWRLARVCSRPTPDDGAARIAAAGSPHDRFPVYGAPDDGFAIDRAPHDRLSIRGPPDDGLSVGGARADEIERPRDGAISAATRGTPDDVVDGAGVDPPFARRRGASSWTRSGRRARS